MTKDVWFVNDVPTDVSPVGKDAGNPNIMMMSYIKGDNGDQVSYASDDTVTINVLHTYNEVSNNISFKLRQF